jgi:hypothetical protein
MVGWGVGDGGGREGGRVGVVGKERMNVEISSFHSFPIQPRLVRQYFQFTNLETWAQQG